MAFDYDKYMRPGKLPHIWCPGCAHGIVMKSIIRAIDRVGLEKDRTVIVSGIGCASRMPGYVDFNTLHTTHGRSLAFATGVKMADPSLNVICVAGDGDALAIGGNHFIHACRRNVDITMVVFNNNIYGMTGGAVLTHHSPREICQYHPLRESRLCFRCCGAQYGRWSDLCITEHSLPCRSA